MLNKNLVKNFIIKYYSFFLFSGFYVGLEVILFTGNEALSRIYTIPVRLVFPIFVLIMIKANGKFHTNKNTLLVFLLFAYYLVKVLMSANRYDAVLSRSWFEYILYFLIYCLSTFLFFSNISLNKFLPTVIKTTLFSGFLLSITTIYLYYDVLFSGLGRINMLQYEEGMNESEIISPLALAYGAALNLSLIIPYYKIYANRKFITKIYLVLNCILSLLIFALGATRGALIALILSILYYIFSAKGSKVKNVIITAIFIPIFIYIMDLSGSNLISRTSNTINEGDSSGRDSLWTATINEFTTYPIFGGRIEVSGIYPHNIFLEVAMSMGIIGLFLFLWLIIGSIKKVNLLKNEFKIIITIIFINAISQHMFTGAFWGSILLFFSLGLMNSKRENST